jgi:peptidoglycan/LPS O-acetylase OafA/YrhL
LAEPNSQQVRSPLAGRIVQFDGLRAVAILAVFLNHAFGARLLWAGVDVFFVLSGFLITSILLDRKQGRRSYFSYFYTRRAFRILPPYAVSLGVAALVYGPTFLRHWRYFAFFAMNVYSVVFPHANMPLPYWSLAVEEQFYLVWPLLILFCPERWVLRLSLLGILLTPWLRLAGVFAHLHEATIYFLTPFRADLLCAGALLACLIRSHAARTLQLGSRWAQPLCLGSFALMGVLQVFPSFRLSSNQWEGNVLLYSISLVGSFSFVLWALLRSGWLYRLLTLRAMRYLGQVSYTFYLVHLAFLDILRRHGANTWLTAGVGLAITVGFSALSWHFMERPLIALGARLAPGGPPVPRPLATTTTAA